MQQFAALNQMKLQWDLEGLEVVPLGINMIGQEANVGAMVQGQFLPLLQDNNEEKVMQRYGINKDDLLVLGRQGHVLKHIHTSYFGLNIIAGAGRDSVTNWLRQIP